MKKLEKIKLNDFHTMSEAEMKDILGGYNCMVYSKHGSSGANYTCEQHPMKEGIHPHPYDKDMLVDYRLDWRGYFCKDYSE